MFGIQKAPWGSAGGRPCLNCYRTHGQRSLYDSGERKFHRRQGGIYPRPESETTRSGFVILGESTTGGCTSGAPNSIYTSKWSPCIASWSPFETDHQMERTIRGHMMRLTMRWCWERLQNVLLKSKSKADARLRFVRCAYYCIFICMDNIYTDKRKSCRKRRFTRPSILSAPRMLYVWLTLCSDLNNKLRVNWPV